MLESVTRSWISGWQRDAGQPARHSAALFVILTATVPRRWIYLILPLVALVYTFLFRIKLISICFLSSWVQVLCEIRDSFECVIVSSTLYFLQWLPSLVIWLFRKDTIWVNRQFLYSQMAQPVKWQPIEPFKAFESFMVESRRWLNWLGLVTRKDAGRFLPFAIHSVRFYISLIENNRVINPCKSIKLYNMT